MTIKVSVVLAGKQHDMPVNFAALRSLSARGIDPLACAQKAVSGAPAISLLQAVELLHAGLSAAGAGLSIEAVGAQALEDTAAAVNAAVEYLCAFCTGGPERKNVVAAQEVK